MKNPLYFISLLIISLLFILAYYFYPYLPDNIITHWGITGEPDGFSNKDGIFFMPFFTLVLYFILVFLPKIILLCVPKEEYSKARGKEFENIFSKFLIIFLLYMLYIFVWSLLWNLGLEINTYVAIIPAMVIFLYITIRLFKDNKLK
ncbi:MAG TPA: hypothetical protein DCS12_00690 [Clostridiales bacterium]|nr:hypothetical protein [Clostridiales bacterium]